MADSEWERIAEETLKQAERVDAPLEDFLDGLKEIIDILLDRWQAG